MGGDMKMEKNQAVGERYDFFSAKRLGHIIMIRFKENLLFYASDLSAKEKVLKYLDLVSENDSIKVVVILGFPYKSGCEEYLEFYRQVFEAKLGQQAINRMYNAVNQLITKIVKLNKIVIHGDSGRVISMFLNVSLACDYRIVADNTVFENPCLRLGLVPKGGGAYFLSKILGPGKALDMLLSEKDFTAHEALRLGLVDKVVPSEKLVESSLDKAKEFAQKPTHTLSGVKSLLNYSKKELIECLELENQVLLRIVASSDFRKRLEG